MAEGIPTDVLDALAEVRESGICNMWARNQVINSLLMDNEAEPAVSDAISWLVDNPKRYMEALMAMGERRAQARP